MNQPPIYLVAGARPNFIKLAPLARQLRSRERLPFQIIHTGQHYDHAMSESFFSSLEIQDPDVNLGVGSGTQGLQTARLLKRFEALLLEKPPKAVIVFGDVNSTLACSLAAVKLHIPVAHVEAGLRSFDRGMPEEINRIVTDLLSDLLFASEPSGVKNLKREGIDAEKIYLVGNIMIDSLEYMLPQALKLDIGARHGLKPGEYALLTMHRPSNVDNPQILIQLLETFQEISSNIPVFFPVHPRTAQRINEYRVSIDGMNNIKFIEPIDYIDSLSLQKNARVVFTDSGGMQEETSYLDVPCITLRENTERPITLELGTSTLVGNEPERILRAFDRVMSGGYKRSEPIPLWDGHTAERIVEHLEVAYG